MAEGPFKQEPSACTTMRPATPSDFNRLYKTHLKHLKLKGLQPKSIEAHARAIRRIGAYFGYRIEGLSEAQPVEYFTDRLETHPWSAAKLNLYGLKFFYAHVLRKPWVAPGLVKPPKSQHLPDIVTVLEAARLFDATRILSYRVFFTLYSLGLRLGESLRLQVGDIDAERARVHVRNSKGNKDRFVPLPDTTLTVLRDFWRTHRNPVWLFPNRRGGLRAAARATTPLDRGGIQLTLRKVAAQCGIRKRSHHTPYATPTPPT